MSPLVSVATRDTGSPLFTGVFDSRTGAALAGFMHDGDAAGINYYPSTWTDATEAAEYAGPTAWARIVEEPFLGCVDPDLVMTQTMTLSFIGDLRQCGHIFALPFPLNVAAATFEDHQWCPSDDLGHAVVLFATADDHPDFSTACPRPESAQIPYLCYAQ